MAVLGATFGTFSVRLPSRSRASSVAPGRGTGLYVVADPRHHFVDLFLQFHVLLKVYLLPFTVSELIPHFDQPFDYRLLA